MHELFTHREAILDDLPQICSFPQNATELYFMYPKAKFPLTFEQLKFNFENRSNSTVFLHGTRIVGYANMYDVEPGNKCTMGNVIIHPEYRGKGVSKYIIQVMEEIASQKYQAKELHLTCFNTNTPALLLYQSTGFTVYAMEKRQDFEGKPIIAINMKKELNFYVI